MKIKIAAIGLFTTIAVFTSTVPSQAQQYGVAYRQVGQWNVETVVENGKFFGCRANTRTATGDIRLLQYADGNWVVTVPDLNFAPGTKLSGMLSVNRASIPVAMTVSVANRREAVKINNDILDALRQGGRMNLEIGGKSFTWQMNDAAAAIGTVQDCRTAAIKFGVPARPNSAQNNGGQPASPRSSQGASVSAQLDDAWQPVLRRWMGNGWKPFHPGGYNFSTKPNEAKRWGAGLVAGKAVTFAAVCSDCTGVELVLRDAFGGIAATSRAGQGAASLTHTPAITGKGSIEIKAIGCRQPACPIRYTSFTQN